MYLDAKGLIVQSSGDGGDTLQREGFWFEGAHLNFTALPSGMTPYSTALKILCTPKGFVRSWQNPYNDPKDTSRDQLVSNIRILGYLKTIYNELHYTFLTQILWSVIKNFSRYPNGDIAFINDYGRFIRAFKLKYLYPLLPVLDLPLIVNSIIRCVAGRDFNNVGDDVNHIGDLAQAQNVAPTPVSFLARKLYKWFRPSFQNGISGGQYALNWYFRAEAGGNPEFAELWAPIIEKF